MKFLQTKIPQKCLKYGEKSCDLDHQRIMMLNPTKHEIFAKYFFRHEFEKFQKSGKFLKKCRKFSRDRWHKTCYPKLSTIVAKSKKWKKSCMWHCSQRHTSTSVEWPLMTLLSKGVMLFFHQKQFQTTGGNTTPCFKSPEKMLSDDTYIISHQKHSQTTVGTHPWHTSPEKMLSDDTHIMFPSETLPNNCGNTPVTSLLKKCYLMTPISFSHQKQCQTTVGTHPYHKPPEKMLSNDAHIIFYVTWPKYSQTCVGNHPHLPKKASLCKICLSHLIIYHTIIQQ